MLQRFQRTYEAASNLGHQTVVNTTCVTILKLYTNLKDVDAGREYHSYVNLQVRPLLLFWLTAYYTAKQPTSTVSSTIHLFLQLRYFSMFKNGTQWGYTTVLAIKLQIWNSDSRLNHLIT
jgi:hypothetical protein